MPCVVLTSTQTEEPSVTARCCAWRSTATISVAAPSCSEARVQVCQPVTAIAAITPARPIRTTSSIIVAPASSRPRAEVD